MKELNIEEKVKRYDEALKEAVIAHKDEDRHLKATLERIFPELKESEDERIRKHLIGVVELYYGNTDEQEKKDCLAWLEKQGEQKHTDIDNKFIRMRETKPQDISEFLDRLTTVEQEFLWEHIAKIRELDKEEQKPAWTAEEEAVLDALIRRLEGEDIYVSPYLAVKCLKSLKCKVQPKQEWSEEDERMYKAISIALSLNDAKGYLRSWYTTPEEADNWLKSLRPQNTWKPSKEQMDALESAIVDSISSIQKHSLESLYNELKKLF